MSGEVWALVGVVVGSVLGAVAQIVGDRLRRRHENDLLLRQERRAAYMEMLAAGTAAYVPLAAGGLLRRRQAMNDGEPNPQVPQDATWPLGEADAKLALDANNRLLAALASVELCAPEDTRDAAVQLHQAVMAYAIEFDPNDLSAATLAERYADRQSDFSLLAKRDLSL